MQRRFFGTLLTLFIVLTIAVGNASAQGGGGGGRFGGRGGMFGPRGGGLQMLSVPDVQKELKMTPEQITKLEGKQQEMRDAMREAFQNGGQDPEARRKMMADMQEMQNKAVAEILDENQQKRFHQLELQQQGPMAIANRKEVADALKLTDDQKKQVADAVQKSQDEMRASMQGVDFRNMSQEDRQKMMTKMQENQKATGEKILAVLTDDQKKQWKDMQGDPFKFPPMRFGGGRRPQGGNGN